MKPIAIQLYTVRDACAKDFPGTLKKIAEVHLKVGQTEEAKRIFQDALDLKPGLKGTATIRERLGFGASS